jgi:hypothetical protein
MVSFQFDASREISSRNRPINILSNGYEFEGARAAIS